MAFYNTVNNASAIITASHTSGDGVLHVNPIGIFGSGGFPIRVTCVRQSDNASVIYAIGSSGATTLNILSAVEGTHDIDLAINDVCQADITAGALKDIHDAINAISISGATPIVGSSGAIPIYAATGSGLTESPNFVFDSANSLLKTPVSDKGGQVFNVKAYGAKGNGVTDDSNAVNAAITAATKGSVLYFPDGRYLLSKSMVIGKDLTVQGTRGNTINIGDFGGNWDQSFYQSGSVILSTLASGYAIDFSDATQNFLRANIDGITLVGIGDATRTTTGVRVGRYNSAGGSFACFYGLRIGNFSQGIEWNFIENSEMSDTFIMACNLGLKLDYNTNANVFSNLSISVCGTGIYIPGGILNNFTGGAIQGCDLGVLTDVGNDQNTFRGIYFENSGSGSIACKLNSDANLIDTCHFGAVGNNRDTIIIRGHQNKIIPTKYVKDLHLFGNQTSIFGQWNGTIVSSGADPFYVNNSGVIAPTITLQPFDSKTPIIVRGANVQNHPLASFGTPTTLISHIHQNGSVVIPKTSYFCWGGLEDFNQSITSTEGDNFIDFRVYSGSFTGGWRFKDSSVGSVTRASISAVDGAASFGPTTATRFIGDGSGITNIAPGNIIPGTSGAIPIYGTTGLIQDPSNFSYDSQNQILNLKSVALSKALILQGFNNQTGNYLEVQASGGSVLSLMNASGYLGVNVSTITPGVALEVGGKIKASGLTTSIVSVSSNTTINDGHDMILVDASSASRIITLVNATTFHGREFTVKKIDSSANTVTISGVSSQTIDGSITQLLTVQWQSYTIKAFSGNWYIK